MSHIYLASKSPRRKEILKQLGITFTVKPSSINEDTYDDLSPAQKCVELANGKAKHVAAQLKSGLVIGADTTVVFNGKAMDKPSSPSEAYKMLSTLSGNKHQVMTGVAVVNAGNRKVLTDRSITDVWFKALNILDIEGYIKTGEPMDKAGAYGIQGIGSIFVDKIYGCYFNVVGLPISLLIKMLEAMDRPFFTSTK